MVCRLPLRIDSTVEWLERLHLVGFVIRHWGLGAFWPSVVNVVEMSEVQSAVGSVCCVFLGRHVISVCFTDLSQ